MIILYNTFMTNAKKTVTVSKEQVASPSKPPQLGFSKFSKGFGSFGFQNPGSSPRGQFKPPAIRITQNKGGGGK
jgi:hypothetical protein